MSILGAHEMGHYLACRYYRIDASLPFFLPAPHLFGTFGAIIRIRAPITNRRALFDIGVAGPIAGFVVAVPVLLIGLSRSMQRLSNRRRPGDIGLTSCLLARASLSRFSSILKQEVSLSASTRCSRRRGWGSWRPPSIYCRSDSWMAATCSTRCHAHSTHVVSKIGHLDPLPRRCVWWEAGTW